MKRLLAMLLMLCLTFGQVTTTIFALDVDSASEITVPPVEEEVPTLGATSGKCGENLIWILSDDGVLTISGTGPMEDYSDENPAPWYGKPDSITSVIIEEGIASIGNYAFFDCDSLVSVDIPDSVTAIGHHAFSDCISLRSIEIPDSVISIDNSAFRDCDSLSSVTIPDSVTFMDDAAFFSCDSLTNVIIGEGITTIRVSVFAECGSLISVTIPKSVITIGSYSFASCANLSEVFYRGAEYQKSGISYPVNCGDIKTATWHYEVTDVIYEGQPAYLCGKCGHYYAPDGTKLSCEHNYVDGICAYCGAEDPDYVAPNATGWSGTTQWTLTSDGVLTIYGKGNMKNYDYSGNQPWLNKGVDIISVVIEEGVNSIGSGAFKGLTKLENVTLPESGLTKVGEAAFYGCTSLKAISLPDGLYTVNDYTFKGCSALEDVRLPKTLVKVGQGAFENCTSLDYIFIPGDTEIIGSWSFKGCTSLEEADMQWADATEIREGAFKNCSSLTEIILPANVQKLGDSAFYGIGATSFTVPATVTEVGPWCFARAYTLSVIRFEGNAPTIGEGAFNKIFLAAYYPSGNATWTSAVMQNYGGSITWQAN